MINKGIVIVGYLVIVISLSIGMYVVNIDKMIIVNNGKVIVGNKLIGIYGGNIILNNNLEILVGNGGIGVYFKGGIVDIKENVKISVGDILGDK